MKQINKSDFFSCFSVYQTNLYDRLKVLAVITMIIDHLGYYIFPEYLYLRLIGRIAFPIFLFLVGFNGNFRRRWSLFFIAIGLQILMQIWWKSFSLPGVTTGNILIVIFGARLLLLLINQFKKASFLVYLFPWVIYMLFYTDSGVLFTHNIQSILDYGVLGFLFTFSGFFLRKSQNIFQKIISVFSLGWLFCFFLFQIYRFFILQVMKVSCFGWWFICFYSLFFFYKIIFRIKRKIGLLIVVSHLIRFFILFPITHYIFIDFIF
ncbi:MAG: hypothetical protein HG456_001750 [candidate division SR1 bacterium]|nr:hypothetical protein [candidate division SR1 bacterium]